MKAISYSWVIVGVGLLVKMTGLGFGRFAYPMFIPSMKGSLGFNYAEMGLLSWAIMLGYLLFSLIAGMLATRFGSTKIVIASLLCGAGSMLSISRLSGFLPLLVFAFAMGAGSAGAHISMTTLPMAWFDEKKLGRALGITTGGTGLGIIVTGLVLPAMLLSLGKEAWRECWLLLASLTFLVAAIGGLLLRDKPKKAAPFTSVSAREAGPVFSSAKRGGLSIKAIFVVYFIFGFAYNSYATYFVAYMVEGVQLSAKTAGDIWAIFGWMCMGSGLLWGFISDRLGRRKALIWNNGIIALSVLLPLMLPQPFFLGLSAFLFGGTFLGTITVIAAAIGDRVVEKRALLYGILTLVHGGGQLLGTVFGGYLRDWTGSFQWSLISSLAGFLLCIVVASASRDRSGTYKS
jgi:MFS family permease